MEPSERGVACTTNARPDHDAKDCEDCQDETRQVHAGAQPQWLSRAYSGGGTWGDTTRRKFHIAKPYFTIGRAGLFTEQ